jgi:hypothetical protein
MCFRLHSNEPIDSMSQYMRILYTLCALYKNRDGPGTIVIVVI